MLNSVAIARAAAAFLTKQGAKIAASSPSNLAGYYGGNLDKAWAVFKGGVKGAGNVINHQINPLMMKSAEFFSKTGMSPQQVAVLGKGRNKIINIMNDPKMWTGKQVEVGKLTTEAKKLIRPIEKDTSILLIF